MRYFLLNWLMLVALCGMADEPISHIRPRHMFFKDTESTQPSHVPEKDISVTAEAQPSTFVNHVNTIFGNFLIPTVDLSFDGPTPLTLVRYYNTESVGFSWMFGNGMTSNYPNFIKGFTPSDRAFYRMEKQVQAFSPPHCLPSRASDNAPFVAKGLEKNKFTDADERDRRDDEDRDDSIACSGRGTILDRSVVAARSNRVTYSFPVTKTNAPDAFVYAVADEDGGSLISCAAKPDEKDMTFYPDPDTIHKGLTNTGSGEISARTNLKNTKLHSKGRWKHNSRVGVFIETEWDMTTCDGKERSYFRTPDFDSYMYIRQEKETTGNKLMFEYAENEDGVGILSEIKATNLSHQHTFGRLKVEGSKKHKKVEVEASNGKKVTYKYEDHSIKNFRAHLMKEVSSSDHPDIHYDYIHGHDEHFLLSRIRYPDGRYLKLSYDDKNRVKEQKGPVGPNNQEATLFRFKYHPHDYKTEVFDANNNLSIYRYSSRKRLKSIERCDSNKNSLREEKFFWGEREHLSRGERDDSDEGHLLAKAVKKGNQALLCTRYTYDKYGNIIEERLYGNLTGEGTKKFSLDDDGKPKGSVESYKNYSSYYHDQFNMVKERSEEDGPTMAFEYQKDSNLLTARFTKNGDQICIREFFEYDNDAVIVKKIIDDGSSTHEKNLDHVTERHITYITPVRGKEGHGVGQPTEVLECYLDLSSGRERHLKSTKYAYDKAGRVTKETLFNANDTEQSSITYSYDNFGNMTEKVHSAGKRYLYSYDKNCNKTSEELVNSGMRKEFAYDKANRLIKETEIHENGPTLITSCTYDNASNKTSMIDPFGQITRYEYDGLGRVTKALHPDMVDKDGKTLSPFESTLYDPLNQPVSVTDVNGFTTTYERTARSQPSLVSYPDGSSEKCTYNKNGTLAKKQDRHGVEIAYEYDFLHRVTKTTVGGEKITTKTYSAFHETSSTDPMGNTTLSSYDKAGRLSEKIDDGKKTSYTYDELGRKKSTKELLGDGLFIETVLRYDLFNRIIEEKTKHSDGTVLSHKKYAYDILDNPTEIMIYSSADVFYTERTTYNSRSLPTSHEDALGHTTRYEYDYTWENELNQCVFFKKTTDPLRNQTIEIFDAYHRIDTIEKHSSEGALLAKTVFRYDAKGNKTQEKEFVYSDGALLREYIIEWTYTPTGLVETCTEQPRTPEEKKTANSYTRGGLLESLTKPDGVLVTHTYDTFSRLACIATSDGSVRYTYSYDLNDNVISVFDEIHNLTHTKSYDNHNRVVKDSIGTGVEALFSYDALDRVTGFSSSGRSVDYHYQSGKLLDVVGKDASGIELYTHRYEAFDLCGHVTRTSLIGSCGTVQQDWDPLGRMARISSQHFEENCAKFDDAGNLLEITERDPQGTFTSTYAYNDLYQLIEETGVQEALYCNDSLHNRLKKNDSPYTVNTLNQLLSEGATAYQYDRNGNPIQIDSMRLSYDGLDRLIAVERPGFSLAKYTYDESHRRISKTTYSWDGGGWLEDEHLRFIFFNKREVGSLDKTQCLKEFRTLGLGRGAELGASIALEINGKTFAPIHDHRYNIALLIDISSKLPSDTYRYSAYGEETSWGTTKNPWRFASKRTDPESGFVLFGRRYYNSQVGRFLTQDPLGFSAGPNLYAYVNNNPLMFVDVFGFIGEPSSGRGFFGSVYDRVSNWFSSSPSSNSAEKPRTDPRAFTMGDGSRITEGQYYPDQVVMYPEGNKGFLQNHRGENLENYVTPYANGMGTSLYEACKNAHSIIANSKKQTKHVMITFNATDGLVKDVGHASCGSLGLPPQSTHRLAEATKDFLHSCRDENISFVGAPLGHSEGCIIWGNMRPMLENDPVSSAFLDFNKATYFGSPVLSDANATYYAATCDVISLYALHNALLLEDEAFDKIARNVRSVGPVTDPVTAHSFLGPGYTEALRREYGKSG